MAKVHPVDPNLIERTRKWLLDQRKADGSWPAERGMLNDGLAGNVQRGDHLDLSTTAYTAWAVFGVATSEAEAGPTRSFLLRHRPESIGDPHTLALVCNALLAISPDGRDAGPYLSRLVALRQRDANVRTGQLVWWRQPDGLRTTFHGSGLGGSVETTALATLALIQAQREPALVSGALSWLAQQKDGSGTWHSTQATVLALKALLAGTGATRGDGERRVEVAIGGKTYSLVIPADQAEVMKQLDLSAHLTPGEHTLTLTERTKTAAGYQVTFRYHEPGAEQKPDGPLALKVAYAREKVSVGETVEVKATLTNQSQEASPMVMLELPVPGGFAPDLDGFEKRVQEGTVAKYQVGPRSVQVYLRDLAAGKALELSYGLRATMAAQVTVPAARAYEYYDPDRRAVGAVARLTAVARE